MPDIDIDFCSNRRGEDIEYVTEEIWAREVAQIHHVRTMAAKAAIKDGVRAMDMPYADVTASRKWCRRR